MTRAARYISNTTPAQELAAYYVQVELDDQLEYEANVDAYYEEEEYDFEFGKYFRIGWLVDNEGLSLVEAAERASAEEKAWREETLAWLNDPANQDSEIYSDIYKDYYGFRPRF